MGEKCHILKTASTSTRELCPLVCSFSSSACHKVISYLPLGLGKCLPCCVMCELCVMSGKRIVGVQFQTSFYSFNSVCVYFFFFPISYFFHHSVAIVKGDGSSHECELNFFHEFGELCTFCDGPCSLSLFYHSSSIRMRARDLISIKKLIQQAPYCVCVCVFEFISLFLFLLHIPPSPQHKIESSGFWPVHSSVAEASDRQSLGNNAE